MKKSFYLLLSFLVAIILIVACSTKKNTATNRQFHAFTARYNTFFNGKMSFDESLASLNDGYKENYTEQILMFPISAQPKDKQQTGGAFDRAILKGNKAIKQHSIKAKPIKKSGWQSDRKQVAMQRMNEYNPFLKHCWLLVAQGQFYNADFLQASATFSYISRHYKSDEEMVAEARIWQARCYAEMNWVHEAGTILENLNKNGFPTANQKQFDRVNADYLIKSGQFEEAVPFLEKAIKSEKNRLQRTRMRYLLGQIYAGLEKNEAAYHTFGQVVRSNPPYELEFAARIRQTEVFPGGSYQSVLNMLNRMAKNSKNKDFLDQVYYAIGNIYMSRQDTVKAIENYTLGIDKSTLNGMDKAICQIRLGDIYYTQKEYVKAQPCFSGALSGIQKEYKDYDRVSRLSSVLDGLVVHVESVHLQDSLQTLAKMPESERLAVIDKIIEDIKKKEEEEAEQAEKEKYLAEQGSIGDGLGMRPGMQQNRPVMPTMPGESSFYFYNNQLVAQGKTQFQNKWGKRALEDNWRRRNKVMNTIDPMTNEGSAELPAMQFDEEGNPIETVDSLQLLQDSLASDPKSREYYLQQIPLTEEDIEASDVIIADGLFNMGMIYKDGLENKQLAVEVFEELERRFPENKYRMDYYYQSYLMSLRYKDRPLGDKYKKKLIQAFPESDYAIAISDPNYEYNIRMMDLIQDSTYQQTYQNYLSGDTSSVRRSYKKFADTYPLSTLIPKFMFLNALSYVQAGDAAGFKAALSELVEKYPQADVTELASEMLKGILRGRTLVQGDFTGMTWNLRFGLSGDGTLTAEDSARVFTNEPKTSHEMLLIYQTGNIDKNQLLYLVAAFNFANFEVKTFEMNLEEVGSVSLMRITGFDNLEEVLDYTHMIYEPNGYALSIDRSVSFFPISVRNSYTLMHGKTLEEYMSFFVEQYGEMAPQLIGRWRIQLKDENEKLSEADDKLVEKTADVVSAEEEQSDSDEISLEEELLEESIPDKTDKLQTPPEKSDETGVEDSEESIDKTKIELIENQVEAEEETTQMSSGEITLKQLEERRKQAELEEQIRKEEEAKVLKLRRKEAEEQKKQQLKDRENLRKQKEKEAKERLKQKSKERKEKERQNRLRMKEKEAQRKANQKEKTSNQKTKTSKR